MIKEKIIILEFAIFSDDTNLNGDKIYAYQVRNNGNTYTARIFK